MELRASLNCTATTILGQKDTLLALRTLSKVEPLVGNGLLDFIYIGSLFSIFTTLIYHKVLINNKTEQDTKEDKHTKLLVEQCTYILTQYI